MIIERCPDCGTTDIEFNGDFWTCEHDHEFNEPATYSTDPSDYVREEQI